MNTQLQFVVAGNINLDAYYVVDKIPQPDEAAEVLETFSRPGGAACNTSVALAKLGARAKLLGFVGRDDAGSRILEELSRTGVDVSSVKVSGKPTGTVLIILDRAGRRAMIALRGANSELRPGAFTVEEVAGANHLHLSSTKPDFSAWALSQAKKLGVTTSYDPGSTVAARGLSALWESLAWVDVLFLNEKEFNALGGGNLVGSFPGLVIVKRGELGSEAPGAGIRAPAFRITPVDTTGAGDAFDAAFLLCWKLGLSIDECLLVANAAGAIKATRMGAFSSPSLQELCAFLRERGFERIASRLKGET